MKTRLITLTLSCVTAVFLTACSKGVTHDTSPSAQSNAENTPVSTSPANRPSQPAAPRTPGGTPIDTTQLDSSIAQAESTYNQRSSDEDARLTLAHAYLARADALTKAQQYGSALGDYRRTLKYDPQNKSALNMSETIISIFKSLGREPPAEGKEPPPKPVSGDNKSTESSTQKTY